MVKERAVKVVLCRFLCGGLLFLSTYCVSSDDIPVDEVCATNTYQRLLDVALSIWSEMYDMQRGQPVSRSGFGGFRQYVDKEYGSVLDLIVGRMVYVHRSLAMHSDRIACIPVDDMRHFERILDYIEEDAEHLLLYDTDRAAIIDQLLRDIKQQLASILHRQFEYEHAHSVNMQP